MKNIGSTLQKWVYTNWNSKGRKIFSSLYGLLRENKKKVLFIIFLLVSIELSVYSPKIINFITCTPKSLPELTVDNVKKEIIKEKILFPNIVLRQAILESGWFDSPLSRFNNNIFGMKHPMVRKTYSKGQKNGYAYFENWVECIKDYKLFQNRYFKGKTETDYIVWISTCYAEDRNYFKRLKNINIK